MKQLNLFLLVFIAVQICSVGICSVGDLIRRNPPVTQERVVSPEQSDVNSGAGNSSTVSGLKLDVVEVRKNTQQRVDPGWQAIEITLAAENTTNIVNSFPSGFCGTLKDTGGFERKAWSKYFPVEDQQVSLILAPGTRVKKLKINAVIPENQSPQSLVLYPSDWFTAGSDCASWKGPSSGASWTFTDLINPVSNLEYPYDNAPTIVPVVENGILQYEEPGLYKMELSNFHIETTGTGFQLFCDYNLENIGGDNLRLSDSDKDPNLYVLGAGNTGRYMEYQVETQQQVAPGMVDSGNLYMGNFFGKPDEWMHLTLAPSIQGQPVAQTIFKVSK